MLLVRSHVMFINFHIGLHARCYRSPKSIGNCQPQHLFGCVGASHIVWESEIWNSATDSIVRVTYLWLSGAQTFTCTVGNPATLGSMLSVTSSPVVRTLAGEWAMHGNTISVVLSV